MKLVRVLGLVVVFILVLSVGVVGYVPEPYDDFDPARYGLPSGGDFYHDGYSWYYRDLAGSWYSLSDSNAKEYNYNSKMNYYQLGTNTAYTDQKASISSSYINEYVEYYGGTYYTGQFGGVDQVDEYVQIGDDIFWVTNDNNDWEHFTDNGLGSLVFWYTSEYLDEPSALIEGNYEQFMQDDHIRVIVDEGVVVSGQGSYDSSSLSQVDTVLPTTLPHTISVPNGAPTIITAYGGESGTSYSIVEESGTVGGDSHSKVYINDDTYIYVNEEGNPIGYSTNRGHSKVSYDSPAAMDPVTGEPSHPQAYNLLQALDGENEGVSDSGSLEDNTLVGNLGGTEASLQEMEEEGYTQIGTIDCLDLVCGDILQDVNGDQFVVLGGAGISADLTGVVIPKAVYDEASHMNYEINTESSDKNTIVFMHPDDASKVRYVHQKDDEGSTHTVESPRYDSEEKIIEGNSDITFYFEGERSYMYNTKELEETGLVHFANGAYIAGESYDSDTGLCGSSTGCFEPTDPKEQAKRGLYHAPSQIDPKYNAKYEVNGDQVSERVYLGKNTDLFWKRNDVMVYDYTRNDDGSVNKNEGSVFKHVIGSYVTWEAKTDADGNRVYYDTIGQTGFFLEPTAITSGCAPDDLSCSNSVIYLDENNGEAYLMKDDGTGNPPYIWDPVNKEYKTDANGNYIVDESKIDERVDISEAESLCGDDSTCADNIKSTKSKKIFANFMGGTTELQEKAAGVASMLSTVSRWSGLSMAMCGGEYCYGNEFASSVDRFMAGTIFGENYWESQVCRGEYQDLQAEEGIAYIETPSGTFQAVAHVEAERTDAGPLLCEYDEESGEEYCDDDMECVEGLCYYEGEDEPAEGYMYKITWGVSSPQDESFTPYIDENGIAVSFNIVIDGNVRLYEYSGDDDYPLELVNGDRDQDAIVKWSINEYNEACIEWGKAPISVSQPGLRGEGNNAGTYTVPDICTDIKISSRGSITTMREDYESGYGSNSGTSTTTGETSTNTDW